MGAGADGGEACLSKKRDDISKKTRFEVFKRDGFTCQYCGAHPPAVILHIDHIDPVANGGGSNLDNLITACECCNLGKGARLLSVVPQNLSEKAREVEEREEQLRGYNAILQARRQRIEDESWDVADVLFVNPREGIANNYFNSIKMFVEKLGYQEVLRAADIAIQRKNYPGKWAFLYFCGICWNQIREQEGQVAN